MKRFVTSDCHGGYKALLQCLDRCSFDIEKDQLIFLGDVVDGWSQTKECIDLLLCIKNLVYILGNHDQWALDYYSGKMDKPGQDYNPELELWLMQGGAATVRSYGANKPMPPEHLQLLQNARLYYVSEDNKLFVHAGFDPEKPIEETRPHYLIWDRSFVQQAYKKHFYEQPIQVEKYEEIYIGHTPTISFNPNQTEPLQMDNIFLIDTGAAFTGCLSIIDIDSKEVWQSDRLMQLYPHEEGRNSRSWNEIMQNGPDL